MRVMFLDSSATSSHKARTHGPGWRTAHASSIDEKGLIVKSKSKATSAPPRAGTTGMINIFCGILEQNNVILQQMNCQ